MDINKREFVVVNLKRREEILGLEFHTNNSGRCFVIDYKNKSDVTIMFYDPICTVKCRLNNLKAGRVSNPMFPSVQGVGYFGLGKYSRKDRKVYKLWCSVLDRCYNKKSFVKLPTYQDVTVCDEWLNFQNFAAWCESQKFFSVKDDKGNSYQLDKDILFKVNKVYSPESCGFVPSEINILFTLTGAKRGQYPVGITFDKSSNKFKASLNIDGKLKNLGRFKNSEDAFLAYKCAKEWRIKQLANKWMGNVEDKTYNALMYWEINIDD